MDSRCLTSQRYRCPVCWFAPRPGPADGTLPSLAQDDSFPGLVEEAPLPGMLQLGRRRCLCLAQLDVLAPRHRLKLDLCPAQWRKGNGLLLPSMGSPWHGVNWTSAQCCSAGRPASLAGEGRGNSGRR
ncbi:hypothetical protein Drorol1_Dr00000679, partial [Drosera rotundifolia]